MNPIDQFLITTHYKSLISLIAFIVVVGLGAIIRNWLRQSMEIYLILIGFYLSDIIAALIGHIMPYGVGNGWYYNIIQVPQLGVTLFFFISKLRADGRRKTYATIYFLFIISHLVMTSVVNGWLQMDLYTLVPMTAVVGIAALDLLRETLDDVGLNPFMLPAFWFAFATLISNLGSVPVTSLYLRLSQTDLLLATRILQINDIVYGLWFLITAFGLIWINRKTTPSYS